VKGTAGALEITISCCFHGLNSLLRLRTHRLAILWPQAAPNTCELQ